MRGQSRPTRKPLERCLCLLTAVLLNKPDHLLLQDNLRLSGATYTVGAGRRAGGDTRPYEILHPFLGGVPLGGIPQRGPAGPLLVVLRGKDFKGEGEIRNPPLL